VPDLNDRTKGVGTAEAGRESAEPPPPWWRALLASVHAAVRALATLAALW